MNALPELESRALGLLALRDHSRAELRRKLLAKGAEDTALLEELLDDLQQRHYLDDERFTQRYIEFRRDKGFGPRRIRQELAERGISGQLVDVWLDENSADWGRRLRQLASNKFGDQPAQDRKEQARQARFLEARGFPGHLIGDFLWGDR